LIEKHYNEILYTTQSEIKNEENLEKDISKNTYNGYILSTLLYIIGEYASSEQITNFIQILYEKCMNTENKKLREESKVELIQTAVKFFVKFCDGKPQSETAENHEKILKIMEWLSNEMADNLEIFEVLNFYYGILKNWTSINYEQAVILLNNSFFEELLPVHSQVFFQ